MTTYPFWSVALKGEYTLITWLHVQYNAMVPHILRYYSIWHAVITEKREIDQSFHSIDIIQ